jgi:hypothetical protein
MLLGMINKWTTTSRQYTERFNNNHHQEEITKVEYKKNEIGLKYHQKRRGSS